MEITCNLIVRDDHRLDIMGKVDLSKYLGAGKKKKERKLKNVIVTEEPTLLSTNASENIIDEGELGPVQVSNVVTQSKGFRRIDNGNVVEPTEKQDTVFRDSSGRIIDIEERKLELEQQKREREQKQLELEAQVNEGDVQRIENEQLQDKLRQAQSNHFSRDDREYNDFMRAKKHFDDPLLILKSDTTSSNSISKSGRPNYSKGISPANRFNIVAGVYWDGIDRSNGFEESVMRRRNERNAEKQNQKIQDEIELDLDLE